MLIISILNRNRKGNSGERATMHFSQAAPSSQHRSSGSRWVCPILPERAVNCHRHLHHRSLKSQWHSQADGRRDYPTKQPPHVHGDDLPKAIQKLANTWSPADILYPQKFNQQLGLYPQCILSMWENHVPRHQWHGSLSSRKTHTSYEFVKVDGAMMVPHGVTPKRVVCKSALASVPAFF